MSHLQCLGTYYVLFPGRCHWAILFRTVGALKGMGLRLGAMGIRMAALRCDTIGDRPSRIRLGPVFSARVISLLGPCLHLCKSVSSVDSPSLSAGSTQPARETEGAKMGVRVFL